MSTDGSATPAVRVRSNCLCCAAGCGIIAEVEGDRLISVRGDTEHPVSRGYLCPKGTNLPWTHHRPDRLTYPTIGGRRVSWTVMLDDLAARLRQLLEEHGPESFGCFGGTGMARDNFGRDALLRLLRMLGSHRFYSALTIDIAPTYRVSELVAGSPRLAPKWIPEDTQSRLVVWMGGNPAVSHGYQTLLADPVRRINAFRKRGGKLWVVDPRRTKTASIADRHLSILPGTDHALLAFALNDVLTRGSVGRDFVECTDEATRARLSASVRNFTADRTATLTGLSVDELNALAAAIADAGRLAVVSGTGLNFQATGLVVEWLRWVLLLATDSLDHAGGMWFSTGWVQPFDLLGEPLPEPRPSSLPTADQRPELPRLAGELPVVTIPEDIEAGQLRGLFVHGGNPVTSFPDPDCTTSALRALDVLAVFDVIDSATVRLATHVLPVTGQLERMALSMTTRPIVSPAVLPPYGQRKPVWWVAGQLGVRLGVDVLGADPDEVTEQDLMRKALQAGRQDLGDLMAAGSHGIATPMIDQYLRRSVLPGGRWNIAPDVLLSRWEELAARQAPGPNFTFITGRQLTRNGSANFVPEHKRRDAPTVAMNPADAVEVAVNEGDEVQITSRNGSVRARVAVEPGIRPGVLSISQGWQEANVSRLTSLLHDVDPLTGQPTMTALPVEVQPIRPQPDRANRSARD